MNVFSQNMNISGNVSDTVAKTPLQNAVAIAVRFNDSTLVSFARSDKNGFLKLENLPLDTYIVILSHPNFGEQQFFIFGNEVNKDVTLNKIILPSKTISLQELVVVGYTNPVYHKGDTLIYIADSFKVKANAVVEDLLKKLPGVRVDAQGKIYSQGKKVDQVLVDGDEFFGSDQTIATKNLNASSVESVQVYDKKNENPSEGSDRETLKVMNLKLKEGSKKGAFGKISGGSDFAEFHEGQLLANHFKDKLKLSIFALASNTPLSQFGWEDAREYGLNNESNFQYNEEEGTHISTKPTTNGLPQTLKTGLYYSDKPWKNTKLNFNYTYNPTELSSETNTSSQYFFSDTSYRTTDILKNKQTGNSHLFNLTVNQEVDSMTSLYINSKTKYNTIGNETNKTSEFYSEDESLTRKSYFINTANTKNISSINDIGLSKRFTNKKKRLYLNYNNDISQYDAIGILKSENIYYSSFITPQDSIDQQKTTYNSNQTHNASISYNHPFNNKLSINLKYSYSYFNSIQNKRTLDFSNGDYNVENIFLTNNFQTGRNNNEANTSIVYEVKKYKITIGTKARQIAAVNTNEVTGAVIKQKVTTVLPFCSYAYTFNDNMRLDIRYLTSSKLPTISQLQPIPDNTNPNQISVGNPNLLPTYGHIVRASFYSYKPISGGHVWCNGYYGFTKHDFSNSITYDSIGRSYIQTVNVNGNYRAGVSVESTMPVFSKLIEIDPSIDLSKTKNINFVNGEQNNTINTNSVANLNIWLILDNFEFSMGAGYTYTIPFSSLNPESNKPYSLSDYSSSATLTLFKKFEISTNAHYNVSTQRAQGYNINYIIWNASVSKTFFKKENLIIGFSANDLLNQNISLSRTVQDNVIADVKTNIISRYFLLKATYKFNSNKINTDESGF